MIKYASFAGLLTCYAWTLLDVVLICPGKDSNHLNRGPTPGLDDVAVTRDIVQAEKLLDVE